MEDLGERKATFECWGLGRNGLSGNDGSYGKVFP